MRLTRCGADGIEQGVSVRDYGPVGILETFFNLIAALIPPSTFLLVLPHLPFYTSPPIRSRTFTSGLSVLHTPPYTHAAFTSRLASLLALAGPKTTVDVAHEENITIGLAGEMIGAVEAEGEVCRDDASAAIRGGGSGVGAEIRWWANVFKNFVWDGQESS